MKVAIYGVSASGKDYLISQLVEYLEGKGCPVEHVRGSMTLNADAERLFGAKFSELSEDDKAVVRASFPGSLAHRESESTNIVVDGHYAFLSEHGDPYAVFTDADLATYDVFFYLDTSSYTVSRRISEQRQKHVNPESISKLKEYEITGLTARLLESGKELHVIKNDGEATLRYIHEVMQGEHSSKTIAEKLVGQLEGLDGCGVVALVDCDKTLVLEDTSSLLVKRASADANELRNIYALDRYTNYQDYMARAWLASNAPVDESAVEAVVGAVTPNAALVEDLRRAEGVPVLAITAGDKAVWSGILESLGLEAQLLCPAEGMSKYVKRDVVIELQKAGKFVVAFGDSMMDSLMLDQADRAYAIANKGYRTSIARLLAERSSIRQLRYSAYQYAGTHADVSACWVRCLDARSEAVKSDIATCKSSSGSHGRNLRLAHYRLGEMVGEAIRRDLRSAEFVTVVLMRSGLPFGQGIADALDCPELFFHGNVADLKEAIATGGYTDRVIVLADGVINTGGTVNRIVGELDGIRTVAAANVISSRCKLDSSMPIYAARVSDNSYVGARQWEQTGGKGPDTSDRLFETLA